jgi:hypothetical protein
MRTLPLLVAGALVAGALTAVTPAVAHDGDHDGPGSVGAGTHSQNVKLLSNSPRPFAATQSDLAFFGKHAVAASYGGFRIIDMSDPEAPEVVTDFRCNAPQGDVTVMDDLLFMSIDSPQSSETCDSRTVTASTPGMFEGIRIFDISDITAPELVGAVRTDCGSHTHTLLPEPENDRAILYVSSYPLGAAAIGPDCQPAQTGDGHNEVSIVEVPLDAPQEASVAAKYELEGQQATYFNAFTFRACHDISVFKELELAAAACLGEAQLWDISDPLAPERLWTFDDPAVNTANTDLWHSATFSWDGSVVAFGDESGGGGAARCVDPDDQQGRIWFVDTETGELLTNYKIPRSVPGICTMHNFNFIPRRDGAKVLVASAYTGGTSVVDVDALIAGASEADAEIGFYQAENAYTWSSYWYNGHVYANDVQRGLDTFLLADKARAGAIKLDGLNPQTQLDTIG